MSDEKTYSNRPSRPNKPVIEKRRRDRINYSLRQLKAILLNSRNQLIPFPNKLEKADILELTVEYVKDLLKSPESGDSNSIARDPTLYRLGYNSCLEETLGHIKKADRLTDTQKWQIQMSLKEVTVDNHNRLFTGFPNHSESTERPCSDQGKAQTVENHTRTNAGDCAKSLDLALRTYDETLARRNSKNMERSSCVGETFRGMRKDQTNKRTMDSEQSTEHRYHVPSNNIAGQPRVAMLVWRPW